MVYERGVDVEGEGRDPVLVGIDVRVDARVLVGDAVVGRRRGLRLPRSRRRCVVLGSGGSTRLVGGPAAAHRRRRPRRGRRPPGTGVGLRMAQPPCRESPGRLPADWAGPPQRTHRSRSGRHQCAVGPSRTTPRMRPRGSRGRRSVRGVAVRARPRPWPATAPRAASCERGARPAPARAAPAGATRSRPPTPPARSRDRDGHRRRDTPSSAGRRVEVRVRAGVRKTWSRPCRSRKPMKRGEARRRGRVDQRP